MKNIMKILLGLVVISFAACTDLDIEPKSDTTNAVVFDDPSSYEAFLGKIYAGLALTGQQGPSGDGDLGGIDEGFSNYLRNYFKLQELTTDEAVTGWGDEGIRDLHAHNWTSQNQFITGTYNRIFYQITLVNEFLRETTSQKLESRGTSDAIKDEVALYRVEARFMRALSYWHAIDLFGDAPFFTEELVLGQEIPEQGTREDIFNFALSELNAIEDEMIAPGQNQYGRADRAALWTLQAKLYLNAEVYTGAEMYTECITACKKVIESGEYELNDVYSYNFNADNHTSEELIFAVPFDGMNTQTFGGTTYLVSAAIGGEAMDPADFGTSQNWGGLRTTSAIVNLFPDETGEADSRALFFTEGQTKEINDVTVFTDGYALPKYTNLTSEGISGSNQIHPDTDFPMFRLADVYLMMAEAVLRGGQGATLSEALIYVNQIIERAYGDDTGNITIDELTLDFILDERARELYWEAHRRTDLIRFNQFTENGIWPWKGNDKAGVTTESYLNLFPIPASDIIANTNLTQNDGY